MSPLPASAAQQSRLTAQRFPGRGLFHLKKLKEISELADFFPTAKAVPPRFSSRSKTHGVSSKPAPRVRAPVHSAGLAAAPACGPPGRLGAAPGASPSSPCCCSGYSFSVCSSSAWNRGLLRGRNRHSPWPRLATPPPRRYLGLVSCHTLLVPGGKLSLPGPGPCPLLRMLPECFRPDPGARRPP